MFTDVLLKFDYKLVPTKPVLTIMRLTSSIRLREPLFDVQCVQLIECSPSISSPFLVSLDSAQSEGTYELSAFNLFDRVIGLSFGGRGHEFPKVKVAKREVREIVCNMMTCDAEPIDNSRKNYARVRLRIFHGLPKREMKQRTFFLMLSRSTNRKLMEIDYKLENPIRDATAIRVHGWFTESGYDFVSCPLVESKADTNANEVDANFIAFGMSGNTRDYGAYPIKTSHRTINTIPIRMKKLQGVSYTSLYAFVHLTIYHD